MKTMRTSVAPANRRDRLAWSLCGVLSVQALLASGAGGCVSDVPLPPCVLENRPCVGEGGAPPEDAVSAGMGPAGADSDAGDAGALGGSPMVSPSARDAGAAGTDPVSPLVVLPEQLVAPCADRAYDTTLTVSGGQEPYQWALTPAVPGWSIGPDPAHPSGGRLHSELVGAGETALSITATDAAGNSKRVGFTLSARTTCWFAYTAIQAGEPTLQLLDPFAEPPTPAVLGNNTGVYDFLFSPDGRYLAYRFGADATAPGADNLRGKLFAPSTSKCCLR